MSEFKSGIYKITNTANGKIYLGQAVNIDKRLIRHKSELKNNTHKNHHLQAAYNKYGESAFTFEPILYCAESLLNEYEIDLIFLSESYKPEVGYNKTMGGESERPTEETKALMSAVRKGIVFTEEHKANLSAAQKDKKRKPHTEEAKANMSAAKKGIVFTEEHKANMSVAKKGKKRKPFTEETQAKMSISKRGTNNNKTKLTEEKVIDILKTCNDSKSMKNAALKYNVSYDIVYRIVKRRTWKHINLESVAY